MWHNKYKRNNNYLNKSYEINNEYKILEDIYTNGGN